MILFMIPKCQRVHEDDNVESHPFIDCFPGFSLRDFHICLYVYYEVSTIAYQWHLIHLRQEKVLHPFGCPALGTVGKAAVDGRC